MGFKDYVIVRSDVLDPGYDDKLAPEIDEVVLGTAPIIYRDAGEFFSRTYPTQAIKVMLNEIANVFKNGSGRKIYPLVSLFGGGKTHTLLTIYHALRSPDKVYLMDKELGEIYRDIPHISIIVVSGKTDALAPWPKTPLKEGNVKIKTLWGYIAYKLGEYEKIREYDEEVKVPGREVLINILSNKRVVVLIDEIAEYIKRIVKSQYEHKYDYVDQVITFIDYLTGAVESTNNVLIITFPLEARGEQIRTIQEGYETIGNIIKTLFIRVFRVAGNVYAPVTGSEEVYGILRKRLFERIDYENAFKELRKLFEAYREHEEIFGETSRLINEVKNSYPFHPHYLNVIWLIADKVTGQRTRSIMKISRVVIRHLITSAKENPMLIMPWHIDPKELNLYGLLFLGSYGVYQRIYEQDILKKAKNLAEKGDLAYIIALSIFLKTYPYDSLIVQRVFPDEQEVAITVYEPVFFEKRGYAPQDVINVLRALKREAGIHHLHDKDGKYWFSRIATVKEWIENEAKRLLTQERDRLKNELVTNYILKLMLGRYLRTPVRTHGRYSGITVEPIRRVGVFSEDNMYAGVSTIDVNVPDNANYKLVAILEDTQDNIRDLVLKYNNKLRTYRNTIVAITVENPLKVEVLLKYIAHVKAADHVIHIIDELYKDYDKGVREVQKSMAKNHKADYEVMLITSVVTFFNKIFYPTMEDSNVIVKEADATSSETSISERVVTTLSQPMYGKIAESLSYEGLETYLRRAGVSIEPGKSITVGNIIGLFKTNPKLPMVKEEAIKNALKEGVESLNIGILDELGKLYFKPIYKPETIPLHSDKDHGNPPDLIRESFEVIHWRDALNRLLENLREEMRKVKELRTKGEYVELQYYVFHKGHKYPLHDIERLSDWENIVRYGFIIREEKRIAIGYRLEIEPRNIEVSSREKIEAKVKVRSIGGYREEVEIKIPHKYDFMEFRGPNREIPDYETSIIIDGSKVKQSGLYEIIAIDRLGNKESAVIYIRLKKDIVEIEDPKDLNEGDVLLQVYGTIDNTTLFSDLERIEEIIGGDKTHLRDINISLEGDYGLANIEFRNTKISVALFSVKQTMELLGKAKIRKGAFTVNVDEIQINMQLKNLLTMLLSRNKDKVKIKVKRIK